MSVAVGVTASRAFEFLSDGMNQTYWALGSWDRRSLGGGVFVGRSLFDGRELYVRLIPREEALTVDFETGYSPDEMRHEVEARVIPGATLGRDPGTCVVTLTIWRTSDVEDETWAMVGHCFATEIHMIKGRLELGF